MTGWYYKTTKGSHNHYKHQTKTGKVTIPKHIGDLDLKTVKSISMSGLLILWIYPTISLGQVHRSFVSGLNLPERFSQVYFLLLEKYSFEFEDVLAMMKSYGLHITGDLTDLKQNLEHNQKEESIRQIYKLMHRLKAIILDPHQSEASENIYYKRHIAAGIPSMYGEYAEPKFEALGLMYRLERTVSKLMNQITQPFNAEYITAKTFRQIYNILVLFKEGLALDCIYNQGLNSHLDMFKFGLASPSFSI